MPHDKIIGWTAVSVGGTARPGAVGKLERVEEGEDDA